jgi:epoxyqueuosine reductase QueG
VQQEDLIDHAKSVGIDLIGFAEMDEYCIFEQEIGLYGVKDSVLDTAVVLGMEMQKEAIDRAPLPAAGSEAMRIYAELGIATNRLAERLRAMGFRSQPFHPFGGPALYPPLAERAGLGEIGVNGLLITKEFGPRLRLSMVATDAVPAEYASPVALGIREYCRICAVCIKKCPGQAIFPLDAKRPSASGKTVQNIDHDRCLPEFFRSQGCAVCIKVCPFSRGAYEKLFRNVARAGGD